MEFQNVTIVKKANVYYDGKVISRTVKFNDGTKKTLGFIQPGTYTFNTDSEETMEILSGDINVELPGTKDVLTIHGEGVFVVPAHSAFTMVVESVTDYCCSYAQ